MENKSRAVVVIPTYNEAKTIGVLVKHLFLKTFPSIRKWNMEVLVVDGNSPDGTADIIRELKKDYSSLSLLVEKKKEGIGSAYFKGFEYAEKKMDADVLIEFDGDFQHPPETIPLLLQKIDDGADLVLGSRRVKGGSYPEQWGLKRFFFSRVGGFLARFILFFPTRNFFKVTDPTTGLKATKTGEAFRTLDFRNFRSRDFGYKLEMLFYLMKEHINVAEIPLAFQLRNEGESKLETGTPVHMLKTVVKLRITDPATIRFVKFGMVGFLGYLVNAFGLEFFSRTKFVDYIASNFVNRYIPVVWAVLEQRSAWAAAFATELAIISNFVLNNAWTFKGRTILGFRTIKKFFHFNLTSFGAVFIQFFAIGSATLLFGDVPLVRQMSLVLAIGFLVVPYNWVMYNKVIWKRS